MPIYPCGKQPLMFSNYQILTFRYIPKKFEFQLATFSSKIFRLVNIPINRTDFDKELMVI